MKTLENIEALISAIDQGDIKQVARLTTKNGNFIIQPESVVHDHLVQVRKTIGAIHDHYEVPLKHHGSD